MTPPDSTPPEDRETLRCPPGRPCGALWCTEMAVHGTEPARCERHGSNPAGGKPTVRMNAVVLEAFREASR